MKKSIFNIISRQEWQATGDEYLRCYRFTYDGQNRLKEAVYAEREAMDKHENRYNELVRQYYAPAMRWDRVDPLAEKYYHISPYAYCADNPVNYFDPDGRDNFTCFPWKNDEKHNNLKLIDYSINYPWQEGTVDIFAHGNPNEIYLTLTKTNETIFLTDIEQLSDYANIQTIEWTLRLNENNELNPDDIRIFKSLLNQSEEWKKGASRIVLHSCYTGAESLNANDLRKLEVISNKKSMVLSTNIAKELSKNMNGIEILAPTNSVGPSRNIFSDGETIDDNGHWNSYLNGQKISETKDIWNQRKKE